jgi:hypothetical protein
MLMISEGYVYGALISFLNEIFDDLFFHIAYQDNNEPNKPFGVVYILSQNEIGCRKKYFDRKEPKEQISIDVSILIEVELFSNIDNIFDRANTIKASLRRSKSIFYFRNKGFKIKSLSPIRSFPEEINEEWLYRRAFEIVLECTGSSTFATDFILSADIKNI